MKNILGFGLLVLLGFPVPATVSGHPANGPQDRVVHVTTTRHIAQGTPEYEQVKGFLRRQGAAWSGPASAGHGDFDRLGDFVVTWSRQVDGATSHGAAAIPDPPYPPPDGHRSEGDVYAVAACSLGTTRKWSYTFVRHPDGPVGWELREYEQDAAGSCPKPASPPGRTRPGATS